MVGSRAMEHTIGQRIEMLRAYAEGCDLFSSLLMDLPDADLIRSIVHIGLGSEDDPAPCNCKDAADKAIDVACSDVAQRDISESDTDADARKGTELIAAYSESCAAREAQDILQEISVDRTRLFCGLTTNGPRPPYESLYMGTAMGEAALSVVASYRAGDCSVADDVRDAPDHLGVEMSFVSELCEREAAALQCGNEDVACETRKVADAFMHAHLGLWAQGFAEEMQDHATTDFYRGIALLLKSFVDEGKALFSAAVVSV